MKSFVICTDATCDLPKEYLTAHEVVCLPMLYTVDGQDYYMLGEGEQPSMTDFYAKMRAGAVTKTAQITPDAALTVLRPLAEAGSDVLYLGFSSALSGTVASVGVAMEQLQKEFPQQKFYAVDTLSASMGEGLMVHYAVMQRDAGKTIDEARDFAENNKQHFVHYFTVDDLHHLHRGGRVSKLTAIVGSILGIKPVLHVSPEGKLINIDKVKGRQKALRTMVEKMKDKIEDVNQPVFISHGDAAGDAQIVADLVKEQFGITDITMSFIGPVVGAHSGPGTVALFFFGKDREKN